MTIEDRRVRERDARRRLIVTTARKLAEAEGWDAVTTRRLSTEIEYSQPVLYKHFSGMEEIVQAAAIEGFGELAEVLRKARSGVREPSRGLRRIAHAFTDFARDSPALYEAMFARATTLRFAAEDTPSQLSAAFAELRAVVAAVDPTEDTDTLAEVLWSALHGLTTLDRGGRLRPDHQDQRIELLLTRLTGDRR